MQAARPWEGPVFDQILVMLLLVLEREEEVDWRLCHGVADSWVTRGRGLGRRVAQRSPHAVVRCAASPGQPLIASLPIAVDERGSL